MNRAQELRTLADVHVENGDCETALEFARRALMIQERASSKNNIVLAPLILELAMIHAALDHDGEARSLLARLVRVVPAGHPLAREAQLIMNELEEARNAA